MPSKHAAAVLAIDPGGTTGCAAGLFDLTQPTVSQAMRRCWLKKKLISWEVSGDHVSQSWEICKWFLDWQYRVHVELQYIRAGRFYIALEDFQPRQLNFDTISLLIIGGIETLLVPKMDELGFSGTRVQPSERWADDDWLKRNRLWVPSDHERDARRHLAGALDRLLNNKWD